MTAVRPTLRAYDAAEKAASEAERANAPDAAELRAKAEALCEVLVAAEAAQEAAHKVYVEEADVEVLYPVPGDDPQNRETWHWCKGWVETVCGPGEWLIVVEDPGSRSWKRTPRCTRLASATWMSCGSPSRKPRRRPSEQQPDLSVHRFAPPGVPGRDRSGHLERAP